MAKSKASKKPAVCCTSGKCDYGKWALALVLKIIALALLVQGIKMQWDGGVLLNWVALAYYLVAGIVKSIAWKVKETCSTC